MSSKTPTMVDFEIDWTPPNPKKSFPLFREFASIWGQDNCVLNAYKDMTPTKLSEMTIEDYLIITPDDLNDFSLAAICPLPESLIYDYRRASEGSLCPYVFLSKDKHLLLCLLESAREAVDGVGRTLEEIDEKTGEITTLYMVGFESAHEAEMFYWGISYDTDIEGEVFFNGHQVLCGSLMFSNAGWV